MTDPFIMLTSMIADSITEEGIVEMMQGAIDKYRIDGDFDHIKSITFVIITKANIERAGGIDAHLKSVEDFKKIKTAFDHTKNNS